MKVEAEFTYEEDTALGTQTYTIGTDGPHTHDSSLTTDPIEVLSDEWPSETDVTLTLTGTYPDKDGVEQTITVTKVLDPFIMPFIYIDKAERDDMDSDVIVYSVDIVLNSADALNVTVSLDADGVNYGSEGPFVYDSSSAPVTNWTITAPGSSSADLVLTVVGEYELDGVTRQISDSREVEDAAPFEAPEIELQRVERGSGDAEISYSFGVTLNSIDVLKVHAEFYHDSSSAPIYETAPIECSDEGPFGPFTVDTGQVSTRMRLVGEYEHLGVIYTVYDSRDIPAVSFTPPSISDLHVTVEDYTSLSDVTVSFRYHLELGDAASVTVTPTVVTDPAGLTTTGTANTCDASTDYESEVFIALAGSDDSVTLTLTAVYMDNNGVEQSFTISGDALASMKPSIECSAECYVESDTEIMVYMYMFLAPDSMDPHAASYSFQLVQCKVDLYDAGENYLQSYYPTEDAASKLNVEYDYGTYYMQTDTSVPYDGSAYWIRVLLTLQDPSTGKQYVFDSAMLELS